MKQPADGARRLGRPRKSTSSRIEQPEQPARPNITPRRGSRKNIVEAEDSSTEAKVDLSPSVEVSSSTKSNRKQPSEAAKKNPHPKRQDIQPVETPPELSSTTEMVIEHQHEPMEIDQNIAELNEKDQKQFDQTPVIEGDRESRGSENAYTPETLGDLFDKNDKRSNRRQVDDVVYGAAVMDEDLLVAIQEKPNSEWTVLFEIPPPNKGFLPRVFELNPAADMVAVWWEAPQAAIGDLHLYSLNSTDKTYADIPLGSDAQNLASVMSIRWSLVNPAFKITLSRRREKYHMVFRSTPGRGWHFEEVAK